MVAEQPKSVVRSAVAGQRAYTKHAPLVTYDQGGCMTVARFLAAAGLVFVCSAPAAFAQLRTVLVTDGLSLPVAVVQDPSQPHVQVVVQQGGRVRVIQNGVM